MAKRKKKRKTNTIPVSHSTAAGFASVSDNDNPFSAVFQQAKLNRKPHARPAYRTEMSIIDYRTLAWKASDSNPIAYQKLVSENRRLARLANSRLRSLEKAGLDMFAYDRAITYLKSQGRTRFSSKFADQSDYKGMITQITELVNFINARSSTVANAREMLEKKLERISAYTGTAYTEEQKYRLGRLLSNDSISALLRDVRANSDEVLELLEEISMSEFNEERLTNIIDRYLMGYDPFNINLNYLNYDDLMDELRAENERLKNRQNK